MFYFSESSDKVQGGGVLCRSSLPIDSSFRDQEKINDETKIIMFFFFFFF